MTVAIVIPFFRNPHLWFEEASVKQAISILHAYDHILVIPKGLNTAAVEMLYKTAGKTVTMIEFSTDYFDSPATYNSLMLSADFYRHFSSYTYILICQTDAWVFRDDLLYWLHKNYDYTGAPWVNWIHSSTHAKNKTLFKRLLWKLGKRRFDAVGNGGFSLRKVESNMQLLQLYQKEAADYPKNEDYFFSFFLPAHVKRYKIPTVKEALNFAFDEYPGLAFSMNQYKIPMACHGWHKYLPFWKKAAPDSFSSFNALL